MTSPRLDAFHALQRLKRLGRSLICGIAAALTTLPALAAERITAFYGPLQFSLPVDALTTFAEQGQVTRDFSPYAKRATPDQLAQLRSFLKARVSVNPTLVAQVTYAPLGETLLQRLGQLIQADANQNGFYALRAALILAAADPDGFSVLGVLRHYPGRDIHIAVVPALQLARQATHVAKATANAVSTVRAASDHAIVMSGLVNAAQLPDLRQTGPNHWQRQTLMIDGRSSTTQAFPVDLYLPQVTTPGAIQPAPVIVILHGAAEDRQTFAYLADHLVSYGFAVVVPESPGSSAERFRQFFAGMASPPDGTELINQPLDVSHLLDVLQQRSHTASFLRDRLNLQQVGVLGHSQGGYAALVLGGARLNFVQLRQDCQDYTSLDVARLVQCQALALPTPTVNLQDPRVQAVLAISPVTSSLLGQAGLSQIQRPVMLVSGSADIVTPALAEQIRPFTWLTTPDRYFVLIENGTHFSPLGSLPFDQGALHIPSRLTGPDPDIARAYMKVLSLAYFQTYIAHRSNYAPYLTAAYAKALSQAPLPLDLVRSLPPFPDTDKTGG